MIQVFGSCVGKEELKEIKSSFENQWLGMGPKVNEFEKRFAKRCGFKQVVMTDSASNSLYLAIKLLGLKEGTEIILPSFTFISCAQAIVENRCVPVFCDVDLNTQNMNYDTVAPLINKNTGAIMVVHYAGKPVNMQPIVELGIPIIEDCAHAVDSSINGVHCGALGDIGIFSFDSMKNISCGEGGAITASSPTFIEKIRRLRYCGIAKSGLDSAKENKSRWWETEVLFHSLRHMPNDIIASIGLAQLKKLDKLQTRRKFVWDLYQKEFENYNWFQRPVGPKTNEVHSYFTYFIQIPLLRDKLAKHLLESGIYTTLRYFPLHMTNLFKNGKSLRNTELLSATGLNLPLHPNLTNNNLDHIISSIKSFLI